MTNLKEQLEKKRDELAFKFTNDVSGVSQSILSPSGCYKAGFDAAVEDLLPKLEIAIILWKACKTSIERD